MNETDDIGKAILCPAEGCEVVLHALPGAVQTGDGKQWVEWGDLDEQSYIHIEQRHPKLPDQTVAIMLPVQHAIIATAAASDHIGLLRALRMVIAEQLAAGCPPRDLASLSRRVQELSKEITSIEERLRKDERESNPCKHCDGTGVGRKGEADGSADTNDAWRPD